MKILWFCFNHEIKIQRNCEIKMPEISGAHPKINTQKPCVVKFFYISLIYNNYKIYFYCFVSFLFCTGV